MGTHLTILAILYLLTSIGELLVALAIFGMTAGMGVFMEGGMGWLAGAIGAFAGFFMLLLGLPGLILGYGLLTRRSWSWLLGLVIGVLSLFNFPIGTVLGLYTFWVLTRPESKALLAVGAHDALPRSG
ncbi:MAG: hypothetical protein ACRELX_09970 [Longimicrobiales bacterium]